MGYRTLPCALRLVVPQVNAALGAAMSRRWCGGAGFRPVEVGKAVVSLRCTPNMRLRLRWSSATAGAADLRGDKRPAGAVALVDRYIKARLIGEALPASAVLRATRQSVK